MPTPSSPAIHSTRLASTKASRCAPSRRSFHRAEDFQAARHSELRPFELHQRLERRAVLHAFVHLHVGRGVVATPHPASVHAELLLHLFKQFIHEGRSASDLLRIQLVIDVVVQTGATTSSSPRAASTTVPPLNSSPGRAAPCICTMRRFTLSLIHI